MARQRKPTKRQEAFIENMANPSIKTQTEAYQLAYPNVAYETAMVNSSKLLRNAKISDAIEQRKKRAILHAGVTPEEVLGGAAFQMRASIDDVIADDGSFSLEKARTTGAIDLVKKLKETTKTITDKHGNSETIKTVEVEMLTNQDGRKEVANYIGLEKFAPRENNNLEFYCDIIIEMAKKYQQAIDYALQLALSTNRIPSELVPELERRLLGKGNV